MIYNLVKYLRDNLVGETIYINHTFGTVPDRHIIVIDYDGRSNAWFKYTELNIQILVRASDSPKCRKLSNDVYDLIDNKFGLILPSITVDSIVYNEIQTAQISANNEPQFIGLDKDLPLYSTNYRVILSKE